LNPDVISRLNEEGDGIADVGEIGTADEIDNWGGSVG
jgi:hypothetical protein